MKIIGQPEQIRLAAEMLAKISPVYGGDPEEARRRIEETIREAGTDPRCFSSTTGGHIVLFDRGPGEVRVKVFVDPAAGVRVQYEELDL